MLASHRSTRPAAGADRATVKAQASSPECFERRPRAAQAVARRRAGLDAGRPPGVVITEAMLLVILPELPAPRCGAYGAPRVVAVVAAGGQGPAAGLAALGGLRAEPQHGGA